ncbi:MAG: hypothetical protein GWN58_01235 [Anaerolineae bacterium]|nr:hypothetical protein [Anaerolineae bacterium]
MAEYYVDNSKPDGDGSINRPWNNIAAHINSLNPGDTMYVRGDPGTPQVYNESVTVTADGRAGSPITIEPYQDELIEWRSPAGRAILAVEGDYFILNGKDQVDMNKNEASGYAVLIEGDYCEILDAEVRGVRWAGRMIKVEGDSATLRNLTVHDGFNGNSSDCLGIAIDNGIGTVIEDCDIYDVHGDCVYSDDPASNVPREFIIRNNKLTATDPGKCSENAIDLKGSSADGGWSLVYGNWCAGFRACDGSCGGSGDRTGEAITVHNSAHKVKVYGNTITDCTGGVVVDDGVEDVWVYDNVFYNMNKRDPHASHTAAITLRAKGVKVWNNTFYACDETIRVMTHPRFGDSEVRNNVFSESGDVVGGGISGVTWSHNAWHNCGTVKRGTGDVTADPQLTDPANGNMRLQATSPCIEAGVDVGLPYDGDAPDMGALERESELMRDNIERCIREVRATAAQLETCISQLETCASLLEDCL